MGGGLRSIHLCSSLKCDFFGKQEPQNSSNANVPLYFLSSIDLFGSNRFHRYYITNFLIDLISLELQIINTIYMVYLE
jgi:hypothetical protein